MKSIHKLLAQLFVVAALMGQIYSTAQAGKLDEAQVMVQLTAKPGLRSAHSAPAGYAVDPAPAQSSTSWDDGGGAGGGGSDWDN